MDATPKVAESQFTRVRIGFRDNLPRAMELTDAFGQVTSLAFTSIERNPALSAESFRFDVPAGADVVGDAPNVYPQLGASGARIVLTTARHLGATGGRYAIATMCIGVGQGIALLVERV